MKRKSHCMAILFIFIILLIVNINILAKPPILRVGIFLDYREVILKGDKGFRIYEIPSMKSLLTMESNQSIIVSAKPDGMIINDRLYSSISEIKIVPIGEGLIQVNDRKYRGEIEINVDQTFLNVINIIEMEKYLYGVLKKEISPEWPEEVLKAQAIAARTFALSNLSKHIEQGYNICATTNSQAYGGVYHEHPATNKAVNDTRGIVVTYQGEPINAVYHSDSGGYTENSEDVWGSHVPYLRSVPSDYEEIVSPPNHQWDYSLTEQEALMRLSQQGFQFSHIDNILIGEKTEAGRVKSVDIVGDNNQVVTLKTNDLRLLIGPTLIRSSLFTIDITGDKTGESDNDSHSTDISEQEKKSQQKSVSEIIKEERDFSISELIQLLNRSKEEKIPEKVILPKVKESNQANELLFTFRGQGNGHGVGLSQWGAYGMASQGYSHEDILKYYYQGIQLTKLY